MKEHEEITEVKQISSPTLMTNRWTLLRLPCIYIKSIENALRLLLRLPFTNVLHTIFLLYSFQSELSSRSVRQLLLNLFKTGFKYKPLK